MLKPVPSVSGGGGVNKRHNARLQQEKHETTTKNASLNTACAEEYLSMKKPPYCSFKPVNTLIGMSTPPCMSSFWKSSFAFTPNA